MNEEIKLKKVLKRELDKMSLSVTITAEKLSKILQSINTIRSDMWETNGADKRSARRSQDDFDDQEGIMNIINATKEKCS